MDKENSMAENESNKEFDYTEPTHDNRSLMIREVLRDKTNEA